MSRGEEVQDTTTPPPHLTYTKLMDIHNASLDDHAQFIYEIYPHLFPRSREGITFRCPLCVFKEPKGSFEMRRRNAFTFPSGFNPNGIPIIVFTAESGIDDPAASRFLSTYRSALLRHAKADHGVRNFIELPEAFRPTRVRMTREETESFTQEQLTTEHRARKNRVSLGQSKHFTIVD